MNASKSAVDPWAVVRDALLAAPRRIAADGFVSYLILAIFSVIDGALMRNDTYEQVLGNPFPLTGILGLPAFFFTLAAAMRMRDPAFAMRPMHALRIFLANLWVFVITLCGMFAFIIPGVWLGTRVSLAPYAVALEGDAPMWSTQAVAESWGLTEGYFWPTVMVFLWLVLLLGIPFALLEAAGIAAYMSAHRSAYYFAPLLMFAGIFCSQVTNIAMLDWTSQLNELRRLRGAHENVPVPTAPDSRDD